MNKKFKKPDEELKSILTPLQYSVTILNGTEKPFDNEYWNNKEDGIYVDIISNEPLFSSKDKYESGTGWPSFTKPLIPENIIEKEDYSYGMERIEIRSKQSDAHLGHLFDDYNSPTNKRYCINSASLKFIPLDKFEKYGLSKFLSLFK